MTSTRIMVSAVTVLLLSAAAANAAPEDKIEGD